MRVPGAHFLNRAAGYLATLSLACRIVPCSFNWLWEVNLLDRVIIFADSKLSYHELYTFATDDLHVFSWDAQVVIFLMKLTGHF